VTYLRQHFETTKRCVVWAYRVTIADITGLFAGMQITYLDMSRNRIRSFDKSVFRNQSQLETLILSGNMFKHLGPEPFTDCTNSWAPYLPANSISEISTSFRGLEHLVNLDLSNNNIEELNPLAFNSFSNSTN
jgi:Leucine-rich repeat (LRR) protein